MTRGRLFPSLFSPLFWLACPFPAPFNTLPFRFLFLAHALLSRFPWLQKLEENAAVVQQELKEALQMGEMLEKTGNNVWIGALTSEGAAYGPDWKTLVLQVGPLPPSLLPSHPLSFTSCMLESMPVSLLTGRRRRTESTHP